MSGLLWRYYLEDDVDSFRQILEHVGTTTRKYVQKDTTAVSSNILGTSIGSSPSFLATSPAASHEWRNHAEQTGKTAGPDPVPFHDIALSRADVNRRDGRGLTILHCACSSAVGNAREFALLLIAHPYIDLYVQDFENGWTALHRAFYFGNITIARAIIEKDAQTAIGHINLIKVKDREGNGPYNILTDTIQDRTWQLHISDRCNEFANEGSDDEDDNNLHSTILHGAIASKSTGNIVEGLVDVRGEELFAFGSNKNITLGLGNEDDRQYPERVILKRPDHVFHRFHSEMLEKQAASLTKSNLQHAENLRVQIQQQSSISVLPAVVRSRPATIKDVQMSKLHTAVLTDDAQSNLYMCGHGLGGRLGSGNERTQFNFICIEQLGSLRRKVVAVALGQDHSLAVTTAGEVFAWGSNAFGQLGFGLPKVNAKAEDSIQLVPKQIFGPLKREAVVGVAASRIHSVAHTKTALYTFGKNEGQLGIIDAQARSQELQPIPRNVATSRFSCAIHIVSAIDRATVCLLENHEVHVLANYGIVKLIFPLEGFASYFLQQSFRTTKYEKTPNRICKITCGGDTICALSTAGEVYTVTVHQCLDPSSSTSTSTTNPNKIRAALSVPFRMWSLKKDAMAARDVGVDTDGSIILTTASGSVWRRVRRAQVPGQSRTATGGVRLKDYKFTRVPGLTRVMAVRASGSGAYCAIRNDCNVTRTQIRIDPQTLWSDVFSLLAFRDFAANVHSGSNEYTSFSSRSSVDLLKLRASITQSKDLEKDMQPILLRAATRTTSKYDAFVGTSVSDVLIPIHQLLLAGRSRVIRDGLTSSRYASPWSNDLISIDATSQDKVLITFRGLDFLTIMELVLYLYTDTYVGFWQLSRTSSKLAFRYRQIRLEVMQLAMLLELPILESAARRMCHTIEPSLDRDLDLAVSDVQLFDSADAVVQLLDGELPVHSEFMSCRCPFFKSLFQGRAEGRWLAGREDTLGTSTDLISIDMKHVESRIFKLVLRHIYADTGEELFDDVVTQNVDEFLDIVMEVLSVADELMLDRLSQVCQGVLGRHVNVRNICSLLNAVAPCAIKSFKDLGLEYVCLNLEALLTAHLLNELDDDLLHELDIVVRENQLSSSPFVRSGKAEAWMHERHPELADKLNQARRAKIDSLVLQAKFGHRSLLFGAAPIDDDDEDMSPSQALIKSRMRASKTHSISTTPTLQAKPSAGDLIFHFEVDDTPSGGFSALPAPVLHLGSSRSVQPSAEGPPLHRSQGPALAMHDHEDNTAISASIGHAHTSTSEPWGKTILPVRLGIKDIMDQASRSRTSDTSAAFLSHSIAEDRASGSFHARTSQRERRKQQERTEKDKPGSLTSAERTPSPNYQPAWRLASSKSTNRNKDARGSVPPNSQIRSMTTPQLTMRQTIANAPATTEQKAAREASSSPLQNNRSVSNPQILKPSTPNTPLKPSSAPRSITIQSIHHQPRPAAETSPTFYTHQPLSDIFSQQAAEKNSIRDAVARRNFQDIQQEQEFQEWWDQETRKVMEAEALATPTASSRGRGKGRGGMTRSRSKGRGARRGTKDESKIV